MFESSKLVFLNFIFLILTVQICSSEFTQTPHLTLYSPDDPAYTDVLVKRVGDNLTLTCEMKGDRTHRLFVWNYVSVNGSSTHSPFLTDPMGPTTSSMLLKTDMQLEDSGQYMCSSPPFSITKFILVQNRGIINCARGAFSCGARCVLSAYVCDGRADCQHAEDEAAPWCPPAVCQRPEMLNCSDGRCVPAAACCAPGAVLCQQPGCCAEHAAYSRAREGDLDPEYPVLYEDRHSPDDYGFIQSTIYTVTACALIFMIAAVLLVSAICKMHMKRAALRSYARAAAARHYSAHQTPRFPPCYEASLLLEQEAGRAPPQITPDSAMQTSPDPPAVGAEGAEGADGLDGAEGAPPAGALARLGGIFSTRYRQVPTECDVEMTAVRAASPPGSPLADYRSPAWGGRGHDYCLDPDTGNYGRELNYMSPAAARLRLARRLTLQLGRFQLSLPRLGGGGGGGGGGGRGRGGRPGTPDLAEISIDDLDFVRLDSSETYTLNGRTIRLLGGNFENYPRPPPYDLRKVSGPPPEYLSRDSRDALNNAAADSEAADNVEMPPRYEDVNSNDDRIERVSVALNVIRESGESLESIPAIDDVNANELVGE